MTAVDDLLSGEATSRPWTARATGATMAPVPLVPAGERHRGRRPDDARVHRGGSRRARHRARRRRAVRRRGRVRAVRAPARGRTRHRQDHALALRAGRGRRARPPGARRDRRRRRGGPAVRGAARPARRRLAGRRAGSAAAAARCPRRRAAALRRSAGRGRPPRGLRRGAWSGARAGRAAATGDRGGRRGMAGPLVGPGAALRGTPPDHRTGRGARHPPAGGSGRLRSGWTVHRWTPGCTVSRSAHWTATRSTPCSRGVTGWRCPAG